MSARVLLCLPRVRLLTNEFEVTLDHTNFFHSSFLSITRSTVSLTDLSPSHTRLHRMLCRPADKRILI